MFQKPPGDNGGAAPPLRSASLGAMASLFDLPYATVARMLWERRIGIVAGAGLGIVAGASWLVLATPRYPAQAQLLINPTDLRVVENSVTSSAAPSDANVAEVESQVRVLVSEKVLRKVVATEGLDTDPEFVETPSKLGAALNLVSKAFGQAPQSSFVEPALQAFRSLAKKADARREERTYVVDLSVTTSDPEKSVKIANGIVQAYLDEQAKARSTAAQRATEELSSRLAKLQDRVREAEDQVESYKAGSNIIGAGGTLISEQQLSEVSNQLMAARARTNAVKARYEQIQRLLDGAADPGSITEAVQSPTIAGLRLRYAEVIQRQGELTAQLGAMHPSVVDIKAQVHLMGQLIDAEVRRIAKAAHGDYERATADQNALVQDLDTMKVKGFTTNQSLVHLRELERDVEANRLVYQAFLVRSRETGQQEQMNTANVRIISEATLPDKTWPPRPSLVLAFAALFGAGAAFKVSPFVQLRRRMRFRSFQVRATA